MYGLLCAAALLISHFVFYFVVLDGHRWSREQGRRRFPLLVNSSLIFYVLICELFSYMVLYWLVLIRSSFHHIIRRVVASIISHRCCHSCSPVTFHLERQMMVIFGVSAVLHIFPDSMILCVGALQVICVPFGR